MNQYHTEFLSLALIHLLAVVSPGPDFAIVVRQSILHGKRAGWLTSLGIGAALLLHVGYCILGIGFVVSRSILAFNIVKYLGAAYLIYIGIRALRARPGGAVPRSEGVADTPSPLRSFSLGFVTNALNPKVTLFFLAVFSVTISASTPAPIQIGYGIYMAFASAVWFSCVTLFFTRAPVREAFRRLGHWFERSMGLILLAFGIRLALADLKR